MDSKRLVLEHAAMMERWAPLNPRFCRNQTGTQFWWELELRGEGANRLPIRIEYPGNYPASPPQIMIATSLPTGTPHVIGSNRMCWYYPGEDRRNKNIWCPSHDTAATCVGVAQRWFLAFLIWLSTNEWPVPDALN